MGYAIIKGGAGAYALNRQIQNLTPVDSEYRKNLAANVVATYGSEIDGVYRVTSINLGEATQPYIYALVNSSGNDKTYTGVSINQISGAITTSAEYTGEAIYVKIKPQTVTGYYSTAAATSAFLAVAEHEVTHTASLDSFVYSIAENGSAWPQSIQAAQTTLYLRSLRIIYDGLPVVFDNLNDIPSELTSYNVIALSSSSSVKTTNSTVKQLTILKNGSNSQREITITLTVVYLGIEISNSYTIAQAANVLNDITFASYNGSSTTPILVANNTTLSASDFKVNGVYSNGDNVNNLTVSSISKNKTSGFESSLTVDSNTTGVYLKVGSVVTENAVSITVTSGIVSSIAFKSYSGSNEELTKFSENNPVVITATYSDNTTLDINVYNITPSIILPGTKTYTVTYNGEEDTFQLTSTQITEGVKMIMLDEDLPTSTAYSLGSALTTAPPAMSDDSHNPTNHTINLSSTVNPSNNRRSYHVDTNTASEKYYYINPAGGKVFGAIFDDSVEFTAGTTITYDSFDYTYSDTYKPRIIAFNTPNEAKQIFISSWNRDDVEPIFKEITFN